MYLYNNEVSYNAMPPNITINVASFGSFFSHFVRWQFIHIHIQAISAGKVMIFCPRKKREKKNKLMRCGASRNYIFIFINLARKPSSKPTKHYSVLEVHWSKSNDSVKIRFRFFVRSFSWIHWKFNSFENEKPNFKCYLSRNVICRVYHQNFDN